MKKRDPDHGMEGDNMVPPWFQCFADTAFLIQLQEMLCGIHQAISQLPTTRTLSDSKMDSQVSEQLYYNVSNTRQEDGFWYCIAASKTCPTQNLIIRNSAEDINGIDVQIYSWLWHWERTFLHWMTDGKSIKNSSGWNDGQIEQDEI